MKKKPATLRTVPKDKKEPQKGRGGSMSRQPRIHRGGRKK